MQHCCSVANCSVKLQYIARVLSRIFRLGEKSIRVAEGQEYSRMVRIFWKCVCAEMQSGALKY